MRGYDLYKRDTLGRMRAKGELASQMWDKDILGEVVNKKWNEEDSYVRAQYKSKAKEQSGQASGKHDDNATYDGDGDSDEAHGALGRPLPLASPTGDFPINPRDVEIN